MRKESSGCRTARATRTPRQMRRVQLGAYVESIARAAATSPGVAAAVSRADVSLPTFVSTPIPNPIVVSDTETAIFKAAAALLEERGPAGLTTRAVCAAVGITAPTLYHHFGGMGPLAMALIREGRAEFQSGRRLPKASDDLMKQLRTHWDDAVAFTFKRPHLYALLVEQARQHPELLEETFAEMRALVQRLVDTGRFHVPLEDAARAMSAAFNGVLSLRQWDTTTAGEATATSDLIFTALVTELSRKR